MILFLFCGFRRRRFGLFFACAFAWLGLETCWGSGFFFCLVGSVGDVSAFFMYAVSHGLGWRLQCWRQFFFLFSGFRRRRFGLQVCNAGRNLFFLFIGFRRRRFGLFCACGFVWVGLETCWGSSFSDALPNPCQMSWDRETCPTKLLRKPRLSKFFSRPHRRFCEAHQVVVDKRLLSSLV